MDLLSCQEEPRKPGKQELLYFLVQNGCNNSHCAQREGKRRVWVWREQDMLPSHFLKAPDFSTWLGSWGSAEASCKAEQARLFFQEPTGKIGPTDI